MRRALWCLVIALITACSSYDDDTASTTAGLNDDTVEQQQQPCACPSGQFCADGVCCDTPCNGSCVACTAALKGSGVDGVCGPVAAGSDPRDDCQAQGVTSCGFDGTCDGSGACRRYQAGTVCRDATGECDLAEQCPGGGAPCPSNQKKAAGVGCTSDGNPCTLDQCDGASTQCLHPAGNAGDVCRAAAGECDLAETCDGTTALCPVDDQKGAGAACTDDGNPCTTDRCDGASVVCQHDPGNSGAVCRDSVGACDAPETCSGSSATCPADAKRPTSFVCRQVADDCDAAEHCAGGDNCPADGFLGSSVECRGPTCSGGIATLAANCPGNSAACPPVQIQTCGPAGCSGNQCGGCTTDAQCPGGQYCSGGICADKKPNGQPCGDTNECTSNFCADGVCCSAACNAGPCDSCVNTGSVGTCSPVPAATVCRPAAGECDQAETCGGATVCPADGKRANGSACGDDDNPCTTDTCNGSSVFCQHAPGNAGTLCRAANGTACDAADHCDGASANCADDKRPAGFVCRDAAGECDLEESCDGTTDACPSDARKASGTGCTDDGNPCTLDRCDGGVVCPHPPGNAGTQCRSAVGPCDVSESCNGSDTACPADAKRPTSFGCRAATGDCDLAENCDGAGDACPPDDKKAAGTACTSDNNPCTTDTCNGSSSSCVYAPGNGGAVCRTAAGPCDLPESCSGSSAACPTDAKRPSSFTCRGVAGDCDLEEKCTGTGDACPTDTFRPTTFQCRAGSCASGVATLASNCTGSTPVCPNPTTQTCPGSQCAGSICANGCTVDGMCASNEFCSGGVCRPKLPNGQPCGTGNSCVSGNCADGVCCNSACNAGVCDSCALTNSVGTCSAVAATTVCRPAVGECDIEERCGGAMNCPADANKNGQACTSDGNVCTNDVCSGTACTHAAVAASTVCRAAAGECDVAETCGGATACPADLFKANGSACTSDSNPCTSDSCQSGTCAHPAANAGAICRAAAGECDEVELCTGSSSMCPSNGLKPNGTACSGDGNVCTRDECFIGLCVHPAGNLGTVCRAAVGECDQRETCTGLTTACPADDFRANGSACTSDSNPCTRDVCESGVCAHPAGNGGTVCRPASTDCDAPELCSGSSATCPANAGKPEGAGCSDDGVPCTRDQCASGMCTHPSNDGATCNDGNQCTSPDTCSASQCRGAPVQSCSCSTNSQCDDQNPCNGQETCVAGGCRMGTPLNCDDGKACTTDGCSPTSGCTHVVLPDGAPCSDGQYCTTDDACSAGACIPGPPRDCSGISMGPCRRAICDEATDACVAQNLPDAQPCDDDDVCTGNDRCSSGECKGQQKVNCRACSTGADCEDSNACTTDLCNDLTRSCEYLLVTGCVPDGGVGGSAGDAGGGRDGGSDAGNDASQDGSTVPPPDARPDGTPGGGPGNGGAGGASSGGSGGTAEGDATYTKDDYGACACRSAGTGIRSWAFAWSALAAVAFAARYRGRRRRR